MKIISSILSWAIGQALLALICYSLYNIFLVSEFNLSLNYVQWLSIIIIFQCIIPRPLGGNNKKGYKDKLKSFNDQYFKYEKSNGTRKR